MRPRPYGIYNWTTNTAVGAVNNIASSVISKSNRDPWIDHDTVTYSDLKGFFGPWLLVKEAAPVDKEVNADEWKKVFATSAAGS